MTGWQLDIALTDGRQIWYGVLAQVQGAEVPLRSRSAAERLATILHGSLAWNVAFENDAAALKVGLDRNRPYPVLLSITLPNQTSFSPDVTLTVCAAAVVEAKEDGINFPSELGVAVDGEIDPFLHAPLWWDRRQEAAFWHGVFQPEGHSRAVPALLIGLWSSNQDEPTLRLILPRNDRYAET